jgi:hypothetical protein
MAFFIPFNTFLGVIKLHVFGRKYWVLLEMLPIDKKSLMTPMQIGPVRMVGMGFRLVLKIPKQS